MKIPAPAPVCIVGAACRLPGAPDESAFRDVLNHGRFTVGDLPADRWHPDLLFHPDTRAPGSAYTFRGGFLADPYGFDIGAFGMSPREAAQVDPQQRILAEVVWEALEDARIAPTSVAGKEVGVYIGVSALDHANLFGGDPGGIESHFMTGNTLSIVANRISYLFDLKGPSFIVDTACSSSLVAVDRALADLASGRIDTAIVGGVNMLLSPASFVGFSRASMLSPTGACRPFSGKADGYVRSEGAVVFVLQRQEAAVPGSVRALITGSAVNSDGRTSGIALPGLDGQRRLLEHAYRSADFPIAEIDFVEAHGTGTAVGDPIEATAIGEVLGRGRAAPLPIGSVKSNIGHLEPASGVAGMLKALIAMEQRVLPATLHLDTRSPHIDFARLNLAPAAEPVPLGEGTLRCGVSSFGFGGTNAHVVMASAPAQTPFEVWQPEPEALTISAHCKEALASLAGAYADRLDLGADPARLAGAVARGRSSLRHRAVVALDEAGAMADGLRAFAAGKSAPAVVAGSAPPTTTQVCFVYNGNGSQWVGMGRAAHAANETFCRAFEQADRAFAALGCESLAALMQADDLADRLASAAVAQPLIYAIQVGITAALAERGLRPGFVLGHSVGEIAAAWAAGAIRLEQGARIVMARATSQEAIHGSGGMATLAGDRATIARLIATQQLDVTIAAENAPASVTVSGTKPAVTALMKAARRQRIAGVQLDIAYPYHSPLLDGIKGHFLAEVGMIAAAVPRIAMVSTVTGALVEGERLDAAYWWRNIREEVLFRGAVRTAAEHGANLFVEIGPRSILASAVGASVEDAGLSARVLTSLAESDDPARDPIAMTVNRAVANGLDLATAKDSGPTPRARVDRSIPLAPYPWQRREHRHETTSAAIDIHGMVPRHPTIGARLVAGSPEWRTVLDAQLVPYLADHVVGGEIVLPATALAEMALAAARDIWPAGPLALLDFDIVQALVLPAEGQREISVRYGEAADTIEIYSRRRLTADEWTLAARGRIARADADVAVAPAPAIAGAPVPDREVADVYASARKCGIEYGPAFRLLTGIERDEDSVIVADLAVPDRSDLRFARPHVIDPASMDASLHGLFDLFDREDEEGRAWLPIRFERLLLLRDHAAIAGATMFVEKSNAQLKVLTIWLRDADGVVVAKLDRVLLRAVYLARRSGERGLYHLATRPAGLFNAGTPLVDVVRAHLAQAELPVQGDARLLLRAHMRAVACVALRHLADGAGRLDPARLVAECRVARDALPLLRALVDDLASAELLSVADGAGTFDDEATAALPDAEVILATFAAEHPLASVDLALAARAATTLDASLAEGPSMPRAALVERAAQAATRFDGAVEVLAGSVDALLAVAGRGTLHVVVAEHGGGALIAALADAASRGAFRLSIGTLDTGAAERARRRYAAAAIEVIDCSEPPVPSADVVLAIRQADGVGLPAGLIGLLHPRGVLIGASLRADTLDLFHGIAAADVHEAALPAELRDAQRIDSEDGHLAIWTAARAMVRNDASDRRIACVADAGADAQGLRDRIADGIGADAAPGEADDVVYIVDPDGAPDRLAATLDALRLALAEFRSLPSRPAIWVALAERPGNGAGLAAIRAFVRVAMNEMADVDLRVLAFDAGDDQDAAATTIARCLADHGADHGAEREVTFDGRGQQVLRLETGLPLARPPHPHAAAAHLQFARPGMLDAFEWLPAERRGAGANEVEVAVAATGLNFRDVMLALGLLSDDVLDEGLAGAVYGLECAGTVVAVGEGVTAHRVGDVVFGFGMDSFRTHVVGHEHSFVPLPEELPVAAAAAVPVAFYTAWYALVELARLQAGETVLIHGGAGGVGLAAIQIASAAGAQVIATVSSPDKEALARLYGAAHVYNSRSLAFADQVQERHGGVDVVLNSLSGEAMRASIRCLRPRGRFVELGKRDYVANSMVGLRPFRRNLSYFGVDVDQLLALDPALTVKGLDAIRAGFADGSYLPLPVTAHRADEVGEAFRLMQSAGHVGKIVVMPPAVATIAPQVRCDAFVPGAEGADRGVQLVVGGTRGFGLATALWLAERGATRIVVASRKGKLDAAARAQVRALGTGVTFAVEKVDVTDSGDVAALVARVVAAHGPITGVYHTAVTLKDAMLDAIEPGDLAAVLAPKAIGAANLDAATRGQPVAQFVLYSSVSALVGNPGQGAYAAANGFLEGLARDRRSQGLPVLAVQWGAIGDVGLLADRQDTLESLARVSGIQAMTAADALERLGPVLAQAGSLADPVVAIADFAASGAIHALPVPSSPAFARVFATRASAVVEAGVDLRTLIADKSEAEAQRLLASLMAEEVAQILRLAVQDIDLDGSIDGLGMDSLMALELRMSIETRYRIELPVMAITAAGSLRELAHRVLAIVRQDGAGAPQSPVSDAESALLTMHGGGQAGFAPVGDAAMPAGSGEGPPT